jgi:serine/threonine protein phosphatase PrpC
MQLVFNFLKRLLARRKPEEPAPRHDLDATVPLSPDIVAQLSPDAKKAFAETSSSNRLRFSWAQDTGKVREHNEDVLLAVTSELAGLETMPALGLFLVADGMGGHALGERAAGMAARAVARSILEQFLPSVLTDSLVEVERPDLFEVMQTAMLTANRAVNRVAPNGGTTLTCAVLLDRQLVVAHIGDSRAYLVAEGRLEQLTHDHTLVKRLEEMGQLTAAEAAVHPQRNILYRALGQQLETVEAEITSVRLPPRASVLLCSDGLWSLVPDDKILAIIQQSASLQTTCEALVAAANAGGGLDNISVVLAQAPE